MLVINLIAFQIDERIHKMVSTKKLLVAHLPSLSMSFETLQRGAFFVWKQMTGYIKLWRGIKESDIIRDPHLTRLLVYFVVSVTHKGKRITFNGQEKTLRPGQFFYKTEEVACDLQISRSSLIRQINKLKNRGTIALEGGRRGTILSFCNWERYQKERTSTDTPHDTSHDTPTGHLVTHPKNKNVKNVKNVKNTISSSCDEFLSLWNENSGSLRKVAKLNATRRSKIKVRLNENPDIEYWKAAIVRMSKSNFCVEGQWATFDWLVKNDTNHVKVVEGNYDNQSNEKPKQDVIADLRSRIVPSLSELV